MKLSEHIKFERFINIEKKTQTWAVETITCDRLGVVKWYSAWRRYAFFPEVETVFDVDCLYTISLFCETKTQEHKDERD